MATSATRRRASRCPTRPTSSGSTRCAPRVTRSWSARSPCAPTTRGCSCARRRAATSARLGSVATIVDGGRRVRMGRLSEDLADRGVGRLMVEGGGVVHTQFLTDALVDELQLVVAPFFVGDSSAPRFVSDGRFPWNAERRATLAEVRQIGDVVLLRYALSPRFRDE